jgi:uncharacterized protein RhaS with RHS repeats
VHYRTRYYDPKGGRFISEDPLGFGGGGVNVYAYVGNGPVNFTDPLGLVMIKVGGQVITVHKNDVDPFPSSPHDHLFPTSQKVNDYTGEIVQGGKGRGRCPRRRHVSRT